ncbi:hypothetical protein [Cereibacter sphaeroides]|uniref:hypothetical protein n=1 Tax=Cereibacter sphaeroides TaxID=1063 RepID=UPI001F1AAA39|nr:hypothetical protein [Cereibacter sphaeroides]MCE6967109.1 hypothetical protein [Cereibacter sphaeroides]
MTTNKKKDTNGHPRPTFQRSDPQLDADRHLQGLSLRHAGHCHGEDPGPRDRFERIALEDLDLRDSQGTEGCPEAAHQAVPGDKGRSISGADRTGRFRVRPPACL